MREKNAMWIILLTSMSFPKKSSTRMIWVLFSIVFLAFASTGNTQEQKPQLITTENRDYYGYIKNFEGFLCQAKGTNLKYRWQHNDLVVDPDYILKFPVTNSSTLRPIIVNVGKSYDGFYQCFVSNSIGTIFGRKHIVQFTIVGEFLEPSSKTSRVNAEVGSPFMIDCPPHQESQRVNYRWWYHADGENSPLPVSEHYFVLQNGTLVFSILRDTDVDFIKNNKGIFCQISAKVGVTRTSQDSKKIIIVKTTTVTPTRRRPNIITDIESKTIDINTQSLTLKCFAVGYPQPTLKWYSIDSIGNAEREISNGGDFRLARYNQHLTISNVADGKAGKYRCKAENSEGTAEKDGVVTVAEQPQWMTNGQLKDTEPPLYSSLTWSCGAFGGARYTWFKDGVDLSGKTGSGRIVIDDRKDEGKSYLTIKNVTDLDNGMYQCTADNELDILYSSARLKVFEKKPEFRQEMGPVTLIENTTGIIICPVFGSPLPRVTWKKNDLIVLRDGVGVVRQGADKSRYTLSSNQFDLLISNVQKSDEGSYSCRAVNRQGSVEGISVAKVGKGISWVNAPVSNDNVTVSLRFELDCEAEGDDSYEIKYRWLRNGLPLQYSARIHWVKEAYRLVILDAIVDDTGTYTCIASAETPLYIERRKDVEIIVKAPANPPDIVRVEGSCWDKTASLTWRVGALNNEEVYAYFIDWTTAYDRTTWTRLVRISEYENLRSYTLDFTKLPTYSQISFRVSVFNRIGTGDTSIPTNPSDCITQPAAPSRSPSEIKGVPGKINELRLEWIPVPQTYWGGPGFNYTVQWRPRAASRNLQADWTDSDVVTAKHLDGNKNSVIVMNPGNNVEWEFRILASNAKGQAPSWTYGSSFSGQNAPESKPMGLTPDRVTARSADISWGRVTAEGNGTIKGYKIQYWQGGIGMTIEYDMNPPNHTLMDLEDIKIQEKELIERYRQKRDIDALDKATRNLRKRDTRKSQVAQALTKRDLKSSIVKRYLSDIARSVSKRDTRFVNVARVRTKREDEDEDTEKEDPLDLCFDPSKPCYQDARDKESQLINLTPYKTYHVRIAAYNSGGLGPWSDELIFNTAEAPPGPPYAVFTYPYDKYCKITWKRPRHENGIIRGYQIYGKGITRTNVSWYERRYIIWGLSPNNVYEAKIRANTNTGWGVPIFRWFQTHSAEKPAKPVTPEVVGYGQNGVNVTFLEPKPKNLQKYGGEMDEDPWEVRPVGGFENEHKGVGGYPETFYVVYRRKGSSRLEKTEERQLYGPREQTWIVIENLVADTLYEFATIPKNDKGEGPQSEWAVGLTGGIIPKIQKLYWYQRDWFVSLIILTCAAMALFLVILCTTSHLKKIYYEGAPKRRKERIRQKIYEPEDVDGGFRDFTLTSARSSTVVTSRSDAPPSYWDVASVSKHSRDDDDEDDSDDEKHEVGTYYSDEKKMPLDDLDEEDENTSLATFV